LEPLLLIPGIGQPLYDLLEPDTRILVNLGYGSITEGWNQGPANVPTTFGLFPDINQTQLSDALSNGWQQGLTDALNDLQNPVSYQDQIVPLLPVGTCCTRVMMCPRTGRLSTSWMGSSRSPTSRCPT
jgi:hypothetical protein